ncbi:GNAT family N-acetyltransferase [Tabrizicola sp. KVB23]|uniref:GNAT family N-acetyltransferase n=1 Tax=Fuscibacter oryzae TaxID=2803939 RepID=A0A8J7MN63_9RHOB|nr:GNAT family N-acetyltransferase [Fuscibacter oryzae]
MIAEITPALPGDAPALARILGDWVRETGWMRVLHSRDEDLAHLRRRIALGGVRIVHLKGRPAGFIDRAGAEILSLYITPHARRQGLGSALLAEAKEAAPRLTLWTFQANTPARTFWAAQGFVEAESTSGQNDVDRNDEGLPDIRLTWNGTA